MENSASEQTQNQNSSQTAVETQSEVHFQNESQVQPPPQLICPSCGTLNPAESFFCDHCGKKIREPQLSTSMWRQILVYSGAILLPPMGIFTGIKYMRQKDSKSHIIGIIAILLTVVIIIVAIVESVAIYNAISTAFIGNSAADQSTPQYLQNVGL